jgi:hypothetical protein
MIRPVGVGRISRGPIGVDGLTMIAGFVRGGSVGAQRERGDAARIDDALDAGAQRRFHDDLRAGQVVAPDLLPVGRPKPIIGRDVHDMAHADNRAADRFRVAHVALDDFDVQRRQIGPRTPAPDERAHRVARVDQRANDRRADESARAGHQYPSDSGHCCKGHLAPTSVPRSWRAQGLLRATRCPASGCGS